MATLVTREWTDGTDPVVVRHELRLDVPVSVGRGGVVPLGVRVPDEGISRVAVMVTPSARGWRIDDTSRNGAFFRPWGEVEARVPRQLWLEKPLVALRILGAVARAQHWVLLEGDVQADHDVDPYSPPGLVRTREADPPRPLTEREDAALRMVFGQFLQWPPGPQRAEPLQLKQAARRLGISQSAVQERLIAAREKALRLGGVASPSLTDPGYLHVLVAAGHLPPQGVHGPS